MLPLIDKIFHNVLIVEKYTSFHKGKAQVRFIKLCYSTFSCIIKKLFWKSISEKTKKKTKTKRKNYS